MIQISGLLSTFADECGAKGFTFIPTWYKYLTVKKDSTGVCTPQVNIPGDAPKIVLALIDMALTLAGIIAIGFVFYGGIKYIMSQGEPDKIKEAQHTVMNAVIGLVIALLATAIVAFVGREIA